jgi:hypothetical protein
MQCATGEDRTIDLAVHMPRSCLLAKDYLNHKYHTKRLAYLLHIASALQNLGLTKQGAMLTAGHGDLRRPELVLVLTKADVRLRVHVCVPTDTFHLRKLAPDRNCLRSVSADSSHKKAQATRVSVQSAGAAGCQHDAVVAAAPLATPAYNAGILCDMLHHQHCCTLGMLAKHNPRVGACAALLQAWVVAQSPAARHLRQLVHAVWATLASVVRSGTVVRPPLQKRKNLCKERSV